VVVEAQLFEVKFGCRLSVENQRASIPDTGDNTFTLFTSTTNPRLLFRLHCWTATRSQRRRHQLNHTFKPLSAIWLLLENPLLRALRIHIRALLYSLVFRCSRSICATRVRILDPLSQYQQCLLHSPSPQQLPVMANPLAEEKLEMTGMQTCLRLRLASQNPEPTKAFSCALNLDFEYLN
jgi:hypothetical protein